MSDTRPRLNCWEFKNCGREPGGLMTRIHGVCPVATTMKFDGVNGGHAAGRSCWAVTERSGCLSAGAPDARCHQCDFYRRVLFEEETNTAHAFFDPAL